MHAVHTHGPLGITVTRRFIVIEGRGCGCSMLEIKALQLPRRGSSLRPEEKKDCWLERGCWQNPPPAIDFLYNPVKEKRPMRERDLGIKGCKLALASGWAETRAG